MVGITSLQVQFIQNLLVNGSSINTILFLGG